MTDTSFRLYNAILLEENVMQILKALITVTVSFIVIFSISGCGCTCATGFAEDSPDYFKVLNNLKEDIRRLSPDAEIDTEDFTELQDMLTALRMKIIKNEASDNFEYDNHPELVGSWFYNPPRKHELPPGNCVMELDIQILENGDTGAVAVMKSVEKGKFGLDIYAYFYAKKWWVKPAIKNGEPVESWIRVKIDFKHDIQKKMIIVEEPF